MTVALGVLWVLCVLIALIAGIAIGVRWQQPIAQAAVAYVEPSYLAPPARPCEVCGEPALAVKFHDGRWLCGSAACKCWRQA